jgi:hypothetical protein
MQGEGDPSAELSPILADEDAEDLSDDEDFKDAEDLSDDEDFKDAEDLSDDEDFKDAEDLLDDEDEEDDDAFSGTLWRRNDSENFDSDMEGESDT